MLFFLLFARVLTYWLGGGPLGHPKIYINLVRTGSPVSDVPFC